MNSFALLRSTSQPSAHADFSVDELQRAVTKCQQTLDKVQKSLDRTTSHLKSLQDQLERQQSPSDDSQTSDPVPSSASSSETSSDRLTKADSDDLFVRIPHYLRLAQELRTILLQKAHQFFLQGAGTPRSISDLRGLLKTRTSVQRYQEIFGHWTDSTHSLFDALIAPGCNGSVSTHGRGKRLGYEPFGVDQPHVTYPQLRDALTQLSENRKVHSDADLEHYECMLKSLTLIDALRKHDHPLTL